MKRYLTLLAIIPFLVSCLKDEPLKREYEGFIPVDQYDDWQISSPEKENMNEEKLNQAYRLIYRNDRYIMARSLLVFRNGKLVAEAYPHDENDRYDYQNIQSCTKTFTSILTGIAIHDQKIASVNEKFYNIFPNEFDSDTLKRQMTIEDALTMRTGLYFNNDENTLKLYQTEGSSVGYILSQRRLFEPGKVMNYNDGAPQLVSKAIEIRTGKKLSAYAEEKLFTPLNIHQWKWEAAKDGTTYGAFSLYLTPRDFGKIGQLLLNKGKWNGTAIIDSAYLSTAVSHQVLSNFDNNPYGYYFWVFPGKGFYAHGHGGQILFVAPDKDLVMVYTAWPYTSGDYFDDHIELINLIYESCE
jgi:CubicO group peptidase (beta-lactamase class C family)